MDLQYLGKHWSFRNQPNGASSNEGDHSRNRLSFIATHFAAVAFGGLMAGLAGACASTVYTPHWADGMVAGRRWIAIRLVVFVRWMTVRVFVGYVLFGAVSLSGFAGQAMAIAVPSQLLTGLPYIVAIVVLSIISSNKRLLKLNEVASLGGPYEKLT